MNICGESTLGQLWGDSRVPVTHVTEQSLTWAHLIAHRAPEPVPQRPSPPKSTQEGSRYLWLDTKEGSVDAQNGGPTSRGNVKRALDFSHFELTWVVRWEADFCNPSQAPAAVLS